MSVDVELIPCSTTGNKLTTPELVRKMDVIVWTPAVQLCLETRAEQPEASFFSQQNHKRGQLRYVTQTSVMFSLLFFLRVHDGTVSSALTGLVVVFAESGFLGQRVLVQSC